jgi:site-specific recombinase XerD/ribosomal protein L40E
MEYADKSFQIGYAGGYITPEDERIIREYVREKAAINHISQGRQLKTTYILIRWRLFLPRPYVELEYPDILEGLEKLKSGTSDKGTPFKKNTLHDYLRILKTFLLWMIENGRSTLSEKKIQKIEVPSVDFETTEPGDLLSINDIMKLLEACRQPRDRALISTLYESGARIGEMGRIQWRDAVFDEYGIKLYIRDQKGEQKRYSRLVNLAPPYMAQWKEQYDKETGNAPIGENQVFLTNQNKPIEYQTVKALLNRLAARAGMDKRVHAHLFRKSRITQMIAEGYGESVVKETMWKNPNTTQFRTYLKLSEKDIDAEILDKAGIVKKEVSIQKLPEKIVCPNCFKDNGPTARYCWKCGWGLTKEIKKSQTQAMKSAENIYAGVPAQTLTEADKVEIANMAAQKILENFTSNNARMKKK